MRRTKRRNHQSTVCQEPKLSAASASRLGRQDQLRAVCANNGLHIVGWAIFMRVRAAHQRTVRVGPVALTRGRRRIAGWFRRLAARPFLAFIGRLLRLLVRAGGVCFGTRFGLQPDTSGIEFSLQRLTPGQFRRQCLRNWPSVSAASACAVSWVILTASLARSSQARS